MSRSRKEPPRAGEGSSSVLSASLPLPAWQAYVQHKPECWLLFKTRDFVPSEYGEKFGMRFRRDGDPEPSCTCGLDRLLAVSTGSQEPADVAAVLRRAEAAEEDWQSAEALNADLLAALKAVEHCPCGARPESPRTHPHVGGCSVGDAIAKAASAIQKAEAQ